MTVEVVPQGWLPRILRAHHIKSCGSFGSYSGLGKALGLDSCAILLPRQIAQNR